MNNETRKEYMKEYHRKNKERLNIAKREYSQEMFDQMCLARVERLKNG